MGRHGKQDKKVEVSILNQVYTFVGEDERQIVRTAEFVDARIRDVIKDYSIVNTLNAMMMAMMGIAAEYLEVRERIEKVEDHTLRLLQKVEELDVPCGVRDRWQT
jgi:cell division protein ZapA (FtsZ GTPase activity inhibitor)